MTENATEPAEDRSRGYEAWADIFMEVRSPIIGATIVAEWSALLPGGSNILDLGCGHGVPVTQVLTDAGHRIYGVDASPTLLEAFRARFPVAVTACEPIEESSFFGRTFDGVVAIGLMFLLDPAEQERLIARVGKALEPGGAFLFTSPREAVDWRDGLTDAPSISLGAPRYIELLQRSGLALLAEREDEGENHHYFALKVDHRTTNR